MPRACYIARLARQYRRFARAQQIGVDTASLHTISEELRPIVTTAYTKPTAIILALNGLDYDRRVANEAASLTDAGFHVTRVGVRTEQAHETLKESEIGSIMRIAPDWYCPAGLKPDQQQVEGPKHAPPVRQWRWKVAMMGAIRRRLRPWAQSRTTFTSWVRWNRELVAACASLSPDLVVATDFDTLWAGYQVKKRTGCLLIYDAHELWVDMHNHMYLTWPYRALFLAVERYLGTRADYRMTVSQGLAEVLGRRMKTAEPTVVLNGPEDVYTAPSAPQEGVLDTYFQGLFQPGRGIRPCIDAMSLLRQRASLVVQGYGSMREELESRIVELRLDDGTVRIVDPCPADRAAECASMHDVGLISVEPICLNNTLSLPNKLFTYLGGALAVLTTDEAPQIAALVREYECGLVIREWAKPLIVEALSQLADNPVLLQQMRANSHKAALELAWEGQFAPVIEWLAREGLVKPPSPGATAGIGAQVSV